MMNECPGKRDLSNRLIGICICCGRQEDDAKGTPPAVKLEDGRWSCVDVVPPAGWPKP